MIELNNEAELADYLRSQTSTTHHQVAFQCLDLIPFKTQLLAAQWSACIFMGCKMDKTLLYYLQDENYVFPKLNVPYNIYPNRLYTAKDLYDQYDLNDPHSYSRCFDRKVYDHYISSGKQTKSIKETLARRLHDHSMTDAVEDFIARYDEKKIVAIMGGHNLSRSSEDYRKAALVAKSLSELDYLMVSGGGPGAMEATHVGSWFADRPVEELDSAIAMLSEADTYDHPEWLSKAFQVMKTYPYTGEKARESLGIPTWLYGHEPPTPFATHIAKYFANSVREEGLLAIAKGGIVFTPGSAGTIQEIFQDLTQNHYLTYGYASPMVFMNTTYWTQQRPVYPVIELMHSKGNFNHLILSIHDEVHDIVREIEAFE